MAGFLFQLLLELLDLGADDGPTVSFVGIRAVVILVVALSFVEFFQRHDLGDDLVGKVLLRGCFGFLSDFFLRG